eukprot:1025052-Pelagomonas_calceolata.AAC.4
MHFTAGGSIQQTHACIPPCAVSRVAPGSAGAGSCALQAHQRQASPLYRYTCNFAFWVLPHKLQLAVWQTHSRAKSKLLTSRIQGQGLGMGAQHQDGHCRQVWHTIRKKQAHPVAGVNLPAPEWATHTHT